jgi:hypothetical protein
MQGLHVPLHAFPVYTGQHIPRLINFGICPIGETFAIWRQLSLSLLLFHYAHFAVSLFICLCPLLRSGLYDRSRSPTPSRWRSTA